MEDIRLIHSSYAQNNINKNYFIVVDINRQILTLFKDFKIINTYKVSTSKFGEGQEVNSNKTPLGVHFIKEYIGHLEIFSIFRNRVDTKNLAEIIKETKSGNKILFH